MRVKGAFEKARIYIESHYRDTEEINGRIKNGPCITISRETGAGANKVSEELIKFFSPANDEYLHTWTVFDKNLIKKVIEDHHLPQKLSQYFIEDKLSEIKSTVNELLGIHPSSWILVNKTTSTILQLAQLGNVIIVGRGSNLITMNLNNSFHVRLIAPVEKRIECIKERYGMNQKEAYEYILKEDQARRNYLKKYFRRNVDDLCTYHLVINTGKMTYKQAAKTIGEAVITTYPQLFPKDLLSSQYLYT